MTDKRLADRVVALGVGKFRPAINEHGIHVRSYDMYQINHSELSVEKFVRDWRVAGALMERAQSAGIEIIVLRNGVQIAHPKWSGYEWSGDESLPRAIVEACVEAEEPVD